MDTATKDILESIVSRRVALGTDWLQDTNNSLSSDAMFTALDVSREAQSMHLVHERHNNMKHVVHEMYETGQMPDYQRTFMEVIPGQKAWVYYPQFADPNTYVSNFNKPAIPSTFVTSGTPVTITTGIPSVFAGTSSTAVQTGHTTDSRGRLLVPVKLIEQIGIPRLEWVSATPEPDRVVVTKYQPSLLSYRYRVDKSGNIQISESCLQAASFKTSQYDFEVDGDKIIIKSV